MLAFILFLSTFITVFCQESAFFEERDVFVSGHDRYHTFRIPAVTVSNRGTVLAFCEGRKKGIRDSGDIDLVLKRSFDGGVIWEPMQIIWDDDTIPIKMNRAVTHNVFEYGEPENFRRKTMLAMIEAVRDILNTNDCESVPATFAHIAEDFRKTAQKVDIQEIMKLDRRAYRGKKTV